MADNKLLITGGAGFIGSNFVKYMLGKYPRYQLINFDALTYAGNPDNLADIASDPRYRFMRGDITSGAQVAEGLKGVWGVVHFAAESHVDRSILHSQEFVRTNIVGTLNLLESCRKIKIGRYIQISTDEVYGSLGADGFFTESNPIAPNSPYAASKASADLLVRSYCHTHGFPGVITRCSNNYGPYQFPEKLIPLLISNAMAGESLPIYGDGLNIRDWIHVRDHCSAIDAVLHHGKIGEVYNVGARQEFTNLHVVRTILALLGKDESLIRYVEDRPGHDRRYAIDSSKIEAELGWKASTLFDTGLKETIEWYRGNSGWIEHVRSGAYRTYYERMYLQRGQTLSQR